jgi:hypothetical protein
MLLPRQQVGDGVVAELDDRGRRWLIPHLASIANQFSESRTTGRLSLAVAQARTETKVSLHTPGH